MRGLLITLRTLCSPILTPGLALTALRPIDRRPRPPEQPRPRLPGGELPPRWAPLQRPRGPHSSLLAIPRAESRSLSPTLPSARFTTAASPVRQPVRVRPGLFLFRRRPADVARAAGPAAPPVAILWGPRRRRAERVAHVAPSDLPVTAREQLPAPAAAPPRHPVGVRDLAGGPPLARRGHGRSRFAPRPAVRRQLVYPFAQVLLLRGARIVLASATCRSRWTAALPDATLGSSWACAGSP